MSSQLKSWFFSTIRGINSRGKYVNFNDGSEPDQVTFSSLMDTTVLKKVGSTYQDQADYVAVNAESNDKFITADNLPIVENSVDGSITLDVTAATTDSEKIKYKINPHFVSDIDQISPDRDTNVFVNPNNLPKVAVEIVGTPIAGQSPLVVGNTITSELDIVNFYETFKLKLNVLTSSFISHGGVLLSTVLGTLRTDVDAKVSDVELDAEVTILNNSINTKATKVTPTVSTGGNGTKVTVNSEGVITNIGKAKASELTNDSIVSGSTIKDALNNLKSTLAGSIAATVVPDISTETVDFNAIIGTKHFVDTSAGNVICTLPAIIDSESGDLLMIYKSTSDANTITVTDAYMSFVLSEHKDNALFHFSDDRWSFVGITPDASFIKDLVLKYNTDTVLEIGKINWVLLNNNHTMSIATPNASNLGKIIIVNNRSSAYSLSITGIVAMPMVLTGYNSIVGFVCVTDGVDYGWEVFSRYNVGDFDLVSQTVTNGVTDKAPSENAVFDAIENAKGFVKDLAVLTNADTTLELNKLNLVILVSNRSIALPTPDVSNLGKIIIVSNRSSSYSLTITGLVITDITLTGENSVAGFVCVTDGVSYGWELFSRYDISSIINTITNGDTTHSPSSDAVSDALALKEPVITKNDLSTPLVWTSANGVASFQPIPVLGDLTYYFTNTASDVATYYKQTATPQVALTSLPFASVTNGQLLATFISEPSNPNRLSIPDGQYLNHLHLGKTGGTKDLQVRAEIWETTSAGVDIVKLADLGPSSILVGSASTEYVIGYNTLEKTLSAVTSRIATKLYAVVGVSGSAPSISIFQGDGSDSRSNLPAPVVDASNYVPYVGALNDVDLGSKKITAQDVTISSATVSTPTFFDTAKKLITTTAQLWGTWVQTWVPKATPVDLDTIGFYDSASTFVGVKSTLLNFWTTYLLPKIQALGYLSGSGTVNTFPIYTSSSVLGNSLFKYLGAGNGYKLEESGHTSYFSFVSASTVSAIRMYRGATEDSLISASSSTMTLRHTNNVDLTTITGASISLQLAGTLYRSNLHQFFCEGARTGFFASSYLYMDKQIYVNAGGVKVVTGGVQVNAGGIYAGASSINASAIFQLDSTSLGSIPCPRMTNAQRTALTVGPTTYGLMVYCTDATEGLWIYKSTGWTFII